MMANRRTRVISMTVALTAAAFVLPAQPAQAALSQCNNTGAWACAWDGTSYTSTFWQISGGTAGPAPDYNCQLQDPGSSRNNKISSYRNNTYASQTMWTSTLFAGSSQSFSANSNHSTVTYNNNYESWKGHCNPF